MRKVTKLDEASGEETELPGYLSTGTAFGDGVLLSEGTRAVSVLAAGSLRCMQLTRTALEMQLDETVLEAGYSNALQAPAYAKEWSVQGLARQAPKSKDVMP